MPYTVKETQDYEHPPEATYQAALKAITGLQGKVLAQDAAAGTLKGEFDKKIHGKVLGDRSQIVVTVTAVGNNQSQVAIEAYPINPVGQKLQFGHGKGS